MQFDEIKNPELQEKLKSCKSADELVEIFESEGMELTDEQLDGIAGGSSWNCDIDDGGYY